MPFSAIYILVMRQSPHQLVVYILISAMRVIPPYRRCLTMGKTQQGRQAFCRPGSTRRAVNGPTAELLVGKPMAARGPLLLRHLIVYGCYGDVRKAERLGTC